MSNKKKKQQKQNARDRLQDTLDSPRTKSSPLVKDQREVIQGELDHMLEFPRTKASPLIQMHQRTEGNDSPRALFLNAVPVNPNFGGGRKMSHIPPLPLNAMPRQIEGLDVPPLPLDAMPRQLEGLDVPPLPLDAMPRQLEGLDVANPSSPCSNVSSIVNVGANSVSNSFKQSLQEFYIYFLELFFSLRALFWSDEKKMKMTLIVDTAKEELELFEDEFGRTMREMAEDSEKRHLKMRDTVLQHRLAMEDHEEDLERILSQQKKKISESVDILFCRLQDRLKGENEELHRRIQEVRMKEDELTEGNNCLTRELANLEYDIGIKSQLQKTMSVTIAELRTQEDERDRMRGTLEIQQKKLEERKESYLEEMNSVDMIREELQKKEKQLEESESTLNIRSQELGTFSKKLAESSYRLDNQRKVLETRTVKVKRQYDLSLKKITDFEQEILDAQEEISNALDLKKQRIKIGGRNISIEVATDASTDTLGLEITTIDKEIRVRLGHDRSEFYELLRSKSSIPIAAGVCYDDLISDSPLQPAACQIVMDFDSPVFELGLADGSLWRLRNGGLLAEVRRVSKKKDSLGICLVVKAGKRIMGLILFPGYLWSESVAFFGDEGRPCPPGQLWRGAEGGWRKRVGREEGVGVVEHILFSAKDGGPEVTLRYSGTSAAIRCDLNQGNFTLL